MRVLGIDPGTRHTGWGVFNERVFHSCGLVRSKATSLPERAVEMACELEAYVRAADGVGRIAIEIPQVYRSRKQKGRQEDVVNVAIIAGWMGGVLTMNLPCTHVELRTPTQWKRNVAKEVTEMHLRKRLSAVCEARLDLMLEQVPSSLHHNVLDAVALAERRSRVL